jgi:hypothetical protein
MEESQPRKLYSFTINLEYTPSPNDPKGAHEFYTALGILMIAWGRLEGHFSMCVKTILDLTAQPTFPERVPWPWEQRANIWERGFNELASLQERKDHALVFLSKIKAVARDRNLLAHGQWESFLVTQPIMMSLVEFKPIKNTLGDSTFSRVNVRIEDLRTISGKANQLNIELYSFSQFLLDLRGPPPSETQIL